MAARPIEVTDDHVRQVHDLAGHGLTQEQIADFLGWSARTLRNKISDDERLDAAYKSGRAIAINEVAKGLYQRAKDGDNTAAIFYLKTQAQWRETNRTEITGKDGGPIEQAQVESPREYINRELARLGARQRAAKDTPKPNGRPVRST